MISEYIERESMTPVASVSLLVVTSLVVMADTDLTSDMRELRGELDQLRNEVRNRIDFCQSLSLINEKMIYTSKSVLSSKEFSPLDSP